MRHEQLLRHRDRAGARAARPRWSAAARERGVHLRLVDDDHGRRLHVRDHLARAPVGGAGGLRCRRRSTSTTSTRGSATSCRRSCVRATEFLTHEVFNTHRSETSMLRYLRRLSARDYALDRGMIPLGSCTMKLNATTEMEPISLPGFADLHPFAPAEDAAGYTRPDRASSRPGWPRSPATTGSRSSRTPARRASSPGCWRSAPTTSPTATRPATSA